MSSRLRLTGLSNTQKQEGEALRFSSITRTHGVGTASPLHPVRRGVTG
jgi:hypothetical protein